MGLAKTVMMQEDAQGWSSTDKNVCSDCVHDDALESAIHADQDANETCDFCRGMPAAPLGTLLDVFVRGIHNEYGTADDECIPFDGREGGYQAPTLDTYDLIAEFYDVLVGDGLVEAVQAVVHDIVWVRKDFARRHRDVVLSESWDRFCEAVQYETRYVLWLRKSEDDENAWYTDEVPPARILNEVGKLIEQLEGIIQPLPAGYMLWRAQTHSTPNIKVSARRLGTAPRELALQANRMSPAGIPMFYGAVEPTTAIKEVAIRASYEQVTVGCFKTSQICTVVDFTRLPPVPSMFDPEMGSMRRLIHFLHEFAEKLSKEARPTYEQIDYVPTQIVTEYLLRIFNDGTLIDGLLYSSSQTGKASAVLDVPNERCVEQSSSSQVIEQLQLILIPDSVRTRRLAETDKKS